MQILDLLAFDQAQVSRVDDLLDLVQVDAAADRSHPAFWDHTLECLLWIPDDAAIWIDPAAVDDCDAFVPVDRRPRVGTHSCTGLGTSHPASS